MVLSIPFFLFCMQIHQWWHLEKVPWLTRSRLRSPLLREHPLLWPLRSLQTPHFWNSVPWKCTLDAVRANTCLCLIDKYPREPHTWKDLQKHNPGSCCLVFLGNAQLRRRDWPSLAGCRGSLGGFSQFSKAPLWLFTFWHLLHDSYGVSFSKPNISETQLTQRKANGPWGVCRAVCCDGIYWVLRK